MTWLELKEKIENSGVKDEDDVWYIDVTLLGTKPEHIDIERKDLGWAIWS